MKKYHITALVFLMVFLTGCGTPDNSAFAMMGFQGIYIIFLISLLTLFFYNYLKNKKQKKSKYNFGDFIKNNKLLFWILLGLILFNFLFFPIIDFGSSLTSDHPVQNLKYSFERLFDSYSWEDNFGMLMLVSIFLLVLASIPTIIYSLLLIFLLDKYKKLDKYAFLTPIIITTIYVITLFIVYFFDHRESLEKSLLIVWIWPLYLFGLIAYLKTIK